VFHHLGVRMMHLTYNRRNPLGDGAGEETDGGLSDFGRAAVAVLKPVPAAPRDVLELEEIAALGWPAPETRWLGRWLLRAAEGWTGRGNSVLPLGEPGLPLDAALAEVTSLGS